MSEAPERIWTWWDDAYDVGLLNEHGDKRYTPNDAKEYVRADRIEELEANLETCKKYRDAYAECDRISTHALRKAVEALKNLADCIDDGCFCSEMQMATVMDKARTTIAELTGGKGL